MEKRRLEKNEEYFTNKRPIAGDKASAASFRRQAQSYEKKSQELDKDPESYFYNKEEERNMKLRTHNLSMGLYIVLRQGT